MSMKLFRSIFKPPRHLPPILPSTRTRLIRTARPVRFFHRFPVRFSNISSPPRQLDPKDALHPNASLSERLRHLIKSYGWYALGVYILFSTIDFGIAFVGIKLLGAEYVSSVVASVKTWIAGMVTSRPAEPGKDEVESMSGAVHSGKEDLYAMLALAYAVHKTMFLPIRVGLTAAFTPRIVSWLAKRGWAGSTGARRAAEQMRDRLRKNKP